MKRSFPVIPVLLAFVCGLAALPVPAPTNVSARPAIPAALPAVPEPEAYPLAPASREEILSVAEVRDSVLVAKDDDTRLVAQIRQPKSEVIAETGPVIIGSKPVTLPLVPVKPKRFAAHVTEHEDGSVTYTDANGIPSRISAQTIEEQGTLAVRARIEQDTTVRAFAPQAQASCADGSCGTASPTFAPQFAPRYTRGGLFGGRAIQSAGGSCANGQCR